jgi:putative transposase
LNLIERLWKFVKKQCLYSIYYPDFNAFKEAISSCLDQCHTTYKEELNSLLTLRFQSFEKVNTIRYGIRYVLYVMHRIKVALHLHDYYRARFGIETSYRQKNQCRIRTTTKNLILRFLFVALAFILLNLWVYLLWYFVSRSRPGGQVVYQPLFPLKLMLEFLAHAVERRFPAITAIYLPDP